MKKCPYCNYENEDNANNCAHCYAGLEQPRQEKPKEPVKDSGKNKE